MWLLKRICLIVLLVFLMPLTTGVHAQSATVEFGVFDAVEVAPGATVQVPVAIRNVQGLYAVDFTLEFDPELVEVVDADTRMEGVQAGLGEFLDPGLLLFNIADNQAGTYRFVMSQYNPSEPKTGDGNIVVLTFKGLKAGVSEVTVTNVELLNGEVAQIEHQVKGATIEVVIGAAAQAATIPVAQATGMIFVGESTPTPTVEPTMVLSPTPTKEPPSVAAPNAAPPSGEGVGVGSTQFAGDVADAAEGSAQEADNSASENNPDQSTVEEPWLKNNWWLPLIGIAGLTGAGVYYSRLRKNRGTKEEINNEDN